MNQGAGRSRTPASVHTLTSLRALIPDGPVTLQQALRAVEHQAAVLLNESDSAGEVIGALLRLPHIQVIYDHMPVGSLSYWNGRSWIVALNARYPAPKLRYCLAREIGHILWHGHAAIQPDWLHHIGDTFAHHLLMPAPPLHQLWRNGQRDLSALADHFAVSEQAMLLRLLQLRPWLPEHRRRTDWAEIVSAESRYTRLLAHWTRGDDLALLASFESPIQGGVAE